MVDQSSIGAKSKAALAFLINILPGQFPVFILPVKRYVTPAARQGAYIGFRFLFPAFTSGKEQYWQKIEDELFHNDAMT